MADLIYYLAAGTSFDRPAERLAAKLTDLGLAKLSPEDVLDVLVEELDQRDLLYAANLAVPQESARWHRIWLGPSAPEIQKRHDSPTVAESEQDALAFLMEEVDFTRTPVVSVGVSDETIELLGPDGFVARIEPIAYEPTDPVVRERIERSLKGIHCAGDDGRLVKRLAAIPGLEGLAAREDKSGKGPRRSAFMKTPASLCAVLRDILKRQLAIEVKVHQAQELLAALFGAANWHALQRHANEDRVWISPLCLSLPETSHPNVLFFRGLAGALWALGRALRGWQGDPLKLELVFTDGSGGPYLKADRLEDWERNRADPLNYWVEPVVSLYAPSVANPEEAYFREAAQLLAHRATLAARLGALLSGDAVVSNQRLGIAPNKTLIVQDWILSVEGDGRADVANAKLHFERLDAQGRRTEDFRIRCWGARLWRNPVTGALVVLDAELRLDREREKNPRFDLAPFSPSEVQRILAFLDIQYSTLELGEELIDHSLH